MVFLVLCKTEIQLLWRSGMFMVAMIITAIWSFILYFVSPEYINKLLGLILGVDIASIALLSCIGLHILEIRQNVAIALLVSPVDARVKVLARVVIISVLAAVISFFIALPYVDASTILPLFFVCFLYALLYSVSGFLLALYNPGISSVVVKLALLIPIGMLPYLDYLDIYTHAALSLLPTYGVTNMYTILEPSTSINVNHFGSWAIWFAILFAWILFKYRRLIVQ